MRFQTKIAYFAVSLAILLLAACAPPQAGVPVTGQTPSASQTPFPSETSLASETPSVSETPAGVTPVGSALPPQVVLYAQQWLATQLGLAAQEVQIVDVEQVQWPDSCLGLGRPNESCAAVVTPGWRAVFKVNGATYEVRTDETGSTIRLASSTGTPSAHGELENIFWSLVSFGPAGAEKPIVQGSRLTLLMVDGKAGGFGGCNAYGGTYQVSDNQISFGQITSTLMACADNNVTEQEGQYLQALQSASSYEVNGNTLRITYDKGQLVFEAAQPAVPAPGTSTPGG